MRVVCQQCGSVFEKLTAETADGRRWLLTRHGRRGGVYWLATTMRADGTPVLPAPGRVAVQTQLEAPTLARLLAALPALAPEVAA